MKPQILTPSGLGGPHTLKGIVKHKGLRDAKFGYV